jgi:hypothetical protein
MSKIKNQSELYWIIARRNNLKVDYLNFLKEKSLENSFDNCNDYLSIRQNQGVSISKVEFGVSTRIALARIISGKEPNDFSL